jgi:asparagine synthetase B (glutamine-hydrolysing)
VAVILSTMLGRLRRRGPYGEGPESWTGPGGRFQAGLAHRRLAIIDLTEAGHQPMLSDDREIGLEFGYVTDSRSIYEGVGNVQPGTVVTWHQGRLETETYWVCWPSQSVPRQLWYLLLLNVRFEKSA